MMSKPRTEFFEPKIKCIQRLEKYNNEERVIDLCKDLLFTRSFVVHGELQDCALKCIWLV